MSRKSIVATMILGMCLCVTGGSHVCAQGAKVLTNEQSEVISATVHVNIPPSKPVDFIDALHVQTKMDFILDGESPHGSEGIQFDGSLKQLLDKVSETYDLKWRMRGKQIVIFEKSFQTNTDLPQVYPEEMKHTANEILKFLPNVKPSFDHIYWRRDIDALYDSMTPDQLTALKSGQKIKVSALTGPQQALVNSAIDARTYGTTRAYWERVASIFGNIGNSIMVQETPRTEAELKSNGMVAIHSIPTLSGNPIQLRLLGIPKP